GLVFCGLGPFWLWSFSSHETGLPNTSNEPDEVVVRKVVPQVGAVKLFFYREERVTS
ncbi:hypothetical protein K443DRAFT_90604, partial [Laccaria amethystina LaAM-08-1]